MPLPVLCSRLLAHCAVFRPLHKRSLTFLLLTDYELLSAPCIFLHEFCVLCSEPCILCLQPAVFVSKSFTPCIHCVVLGTFVIHRLRASLVSCALSQRSIQRIVEVDKTQRFVGILLLKLLQLTLQASSLFSFSCRGITVLLQIPRQTNEHLPHLGVLSLE